MDRIDCDRMFVAVLDLGSFAAAAKRLGTSSGQASKLVAKLEAALGVQLLKRTTRALFPTEIGQAYYDRVKVLIEEFDLLDAAVRTTSGAPSGRLRVSVPVSFGTLQLQPILIAFAQAFPRIQLDVAFSDRLVSLIDEGFDLAIRIGKPEDASLIARKLCDARVVLIASSSYLSAHGIPQTPDDLAAHDCIIDSTFNDPSRWGFFSEGQARSVTVSGPMRFSSGEACLAAAEAGLGIARVPSFVAGPSIRARRVRTLLDAVEDRPRSIYALYPPAQHLALKVRSLIDFLSQHLRGRPAWDRDWPSPEQD